MYPHQSERLMAALESQEVAALVATTPANVAYLTGFRPVGPRLGVPGPVFAVFTRTGTALVVPATEAVTVAADRPDAGQVRCYGRFPYARPARPDERARQALELAHGAASSPEEALADVLRTLGAGEGPVGVDENGLTAPLWQRLVERLAPRRVVSAARALARARAVKAPWEIECLERGLGAAEEGANAVIQALKPGMSERDAVALAEETARRRGAEGAHAIILFGSHTGVPASAPSDRTLRRGDLVQLEVHCTWKGYHARVGRVAVMGEPTAEPQRVHEVLDRGLAAAISRMRPGASAGDVARAALDALRKAGLGEDELPAVGQGIGLEPQESPELEPGASVPLEMGMVLSLDLPWIEPGSTGMRLIETVLVTSRDHHVMNRSARGLVVLD